MKKIYSFLAVATMLTSVLGFTSCQKDEMPTPSVKTKTTVGQPLQAEQPVTDSKTQIEFKYYAAVTDDALALYDVKLTANVGGKPDTLALSNNMQFAEMTYGLYISGKTTFDKSFLVDEGKSVTVSCTVKLKSNWKEIAKGMSKMYLSYASDFKKPCMDKESSSQSECYTPDDASLESKLEAFGQKMANALSAK